MARLIVNPGTASAWEIQLRSGVNSIGRGFANDFRIEHDSVSTAHCQILVSKGTAQLKDLGSTNGSFIDGLRTSESLLTDGHTFQLGAVQVLFEQDPAAPGMQNRLSSELVAVSNLQSIRHVASASAPFQAAPPLAAPQPIEASGSTLGLPSNPPRAHSPGSPFVVLPHEPRAVVAALVPPAIPTAESNRSGQSPPQPLVQMSGPCKSHPKTAGRYYCGGCRQLFCELCVATRPAPGGSKKFCRQCSIELSKVSVQTAREPVEKGFFSRVPSAFGYPFKGSGVFVLVIATILIACLQFAGPAPSLSHGMRFGPMAVMFQIMVVGYVFTYMQTILHATATGDDEMPPLPGLDNMWEDVVLPCLKMLGLLGACFAPAIFLICLRIGTDDSALGVALIPTFILCVIYFPMAFLAVAMLDNIAAANPLHIIPAIMKVPLEYLVTLGLLAALFAMRFFGDELIPLIFPKGIATHQMPRLIGFLVAHAFWAVVSMYLLTVSIRILGLLYVTKKEKLGWLA